MSIRLFIALCSLLVLVSCKRKDESGSGEREREWERMPGTAIQISAKGDYLWAVVPKSHQIMRWHKGGWRYPHITALQVTASADGWAFAVTFNGPDFSKSNVWRFNPDVGYFGYLNTGGISYMSSMGLNDAYAVHWTGCVLKWNGAWSGDLYNCPSYVDGGRDTIQVAYGESKELWRLDANSTLHRLTNDAFQKVEHPGHAKNVDVQSPNRVVMTDTDDNLWFYDAHDWKKVKGQECVQATINYKYIYCIDRKDRIWRLEV